MYQKDYGTTKKIENNEQDATEKPPCIIPMCNLCGLNNNSICIAVSRCVRIYLNKKASSYDFLLKDIL